MHSLHIRHNFSKHAHSYPEAASCQRHAADLLATLIPKFSAPKDGPLNIMELGCGTGFLTTHLVKMYPHALIAALDVSPAMLAICRNSPELKEFVAAGTLVMLEADIEHELPGPDFIHLAVSGLTLQWLVNPGAFFERLAERLPPHAVFAFSVITHGTFGDLQSAFHKQGISYPGPKLHTAQEWQQFTSKRFSTMVLHEESFCEIHSSPLSMLRQIQRTGAVNPTGVPVSAVELRRIINHYSEHHAGPGGSVTADYQLAYFILARKT